jgi:hypothetical protein
MRATVMSANQSERTKRRSLWLLVPAVATLLVVNDAHAQFSVSFEQSPTLQAGQPNQSLDLLISTTGSPATTYPMTHVVLDLQVGNGSAGPAITAVDLQAPGSLFASDVGGSITAQTFTLQAREDALITHNDANGRPTAYLFSSGQTVTLAHITFDTTGVSPQTTWNFQLSNGNGSSHFDFLTNPGNPLDLSSATVGFSSFSGLISVVPEPRQSAVAFGGMLLALAGLWRWRTARRPISVS